MSLYKTFCVDEAPICAICAQRCCGYGICEFWCLEEYLDSETKRLELLDRTNSGGMNAAPREI